ncbi:hypothetical protein PENSPDRAFT_759230 [Peniophora sp. CONT]|nr:hypothetical protein PENSPDRAFT_759230 [Peniophora sp. CONT]
MQPQHAFVPVRARPGCFVPPRVPVEMSDPVSDTSPLGLIIKKAAESRLRFIDICTSVGVGAADGQTAEALLTVEIDSLRNIIAPFTRRLNALRCSLLRLPPEIWRLVFKSVMEGEKYRPTEWLFLGHICAALRSVLLDMHSVWGGIVFSTELRDAHDELLRRAHGAAITVEFDQDSAPSQEIIDIAVAHLTRSRTISAYSTTAVIAFIRQMRLARSFPSLESLVLHPYVPTYPLGAWADEALALTAEACHSPAFDSPQLKNLRLTNIFLPFDPSTLTTLVLNRVFDTTPLVLPPAAPFLDMLRRCVHVQELTLRHWIPELQASITVTEPPIELPSLEKLSLTGHQSRILTLWSLLKVPTSTILDIGWLNGTDYSSLITETSFFVNHVFAWTSHVSSAPRLSIVGTSDERHLDLCILAPDDIEYPSPYCETKQPTSNLYWIPVFKIQLFARNWEQRDVGRAIHEFCTMFQLANINTLDISCEVIQNADPSVFTHFPAVQTLCLEGPTLDVILALNAPPPSWNPSGTLMYPALHTLAISTAADLLPDELDALYYILVERVEYGAPVQVLDLETTDCDSDDEEFRKDHYPAYLDMFEEVVPTLYYCDPFSGY